MRITVYGSAESLYPRSRVQLFLLLIFSFALIWPGSSSAFQRASARINGQVLFPSGENNLPDVMKVTLETINGGYVGSVTLTSDTSFMFDNVPNGQYIVTVESPGFEEGSKWIDINAPYRRFEVMVVLPLGKRLAPSEKDRQHPQPGDETVAVGNLSIPPEALKEIEKGDKEAGKGNARKAIRHYEKALEKCPECAGAHAGLGMQQAALAQWPEAIASFEQAVSLGGSDPKTRRNLAQLYLAQQRYGDALDQLNTALVDEPNHSKTVMLLGEAHLGLGECNYALDYFLTAVQLNPEDHSYLGLGQCYLEMNEPEKALTEFEEFVKLFPKDPRYDYVTDFIGKLKESLRQP